MILKTSNKTAIELAKFNNCCDLELLGTTSLAQYNTSLALALKNNELSDDHTFKNVFGLDVRFFYSIELIENKQIVRYEHGIGSIYEVDNIIYFKREMPILSGSDSSSLEPCLNGGCNLTCNDKQYIVVYSTLPYTYVEALAESNSVLTSSSPFVPTPVQLNENSVLARLDGEILSLSLTSEEFKKILIEAISKYSNQVSLTASKFSMKKKNAPISSNVFQFVPTSNPQTKQGIMFYDQNDDCLKYFDGTKWRRLVWQEDSAT